MLAKDQFSWKLYIEWKIGESNASSEQEEIN